MTGIDPERRQRRLRWATEQLGLSQDASPEEVRAAWLRHLPEEDFVPSSESRWALAVLLRRQHEGESATQADEAAFAAEAERLRDEVEAFAGQFWELSGDERRRRWQELTDRCAFSPTLRARLRLLAAGLVIEPRELSEDARVVELADHVRELFVLRPAPRARARQDILHRLESNRKEWRTAVRRLRRADPALAALGSDLLDKIATTKPKPKRLPPKLRSQPATKNAGRSSLTVIFYIAVCVLGGIIRGFTKNSESPPPYPTPHFPVLKEQQFLPEQGRKTAPEEWKQLINPSPNPNLDFNETLEKIRREYKEKLQKLSDEQMKNRKPRPKRKTNDKTDEEHP